MLCLDLLKDSVCYSDITLLILMTCKLYWHISRKSSWNSSLKCWWALLIWVRKLKGFCSAPLCTWPTTEYNRFEVLAHWKSQSPARNTLEQTPVLSSRLFNALNYIYSQYLLIWKIQIHKAVHTIWNISFFLISSINDSEKFTWHKKVK